ncbi:PH domain-containing protein [Metabacillus litoralis]|uniref:PH domain-containing protein n=1 Tax=Metabacillus litoralis TaxID=152268 RepID=UPI00203C2943|nr:PH domain-containing protein [Metabacillus litoralis]MCM3409822.1 PH domain-containing protein [Metabacillus litoralis]
MFFQSKRDILYFIAIWGTVFIIILGSFFDTEPIVIKIAYYLIGIISIGILIWIWFGTGYKIEDDLLKAQCGPFQWKLNVKEIRKVRKVKSIFTSPALSIDRLDIYYGKYNLIRISPENESEFIDLLLKENPQIQLKYEAYK